jgi:endoglucanase Acf2
VSTVGRAAALTAILALAACSSTLTPDSSATPSPSGSASAAPLASGVVDAAGTSLAETLPVKTVAAYPAVAAVAKGVLPPTNRWYSSLAYADLPAKAYPSPVSVAVNAGSLRVALPTIAATANVIAAQTGPGIGLTIEGSSTRPLITVNDPVWTSLAYTGADGATLATATIAQGWPAVGLVSAAGLTVTLDAPVNWESKTLGTASVGGLTYVVVVSSGTGAGTSVTLDKGGSVQVAPVPEGIKADAYAALLTSPVVGVDTTHSVEKAAKTTLTYRTLDGGPTVVVAPATVEPDPKLDCRVATFPTIDGSAPACAGNTLSWSVATVDPTLTLNLDGITDTERTAITAAVDAQAAHGTDYPADTYFGSKALYRDAQLLALASALKDKKAFDQVAARLAPAIKKWTEADGCATRTDHCFVYAPDWSGVVGLTASFGSDVFNDHHFHYGYLIFAATIAVKEGIVDESAVAPVIDALVADIASPGTKQVPTTRVFDPYAGHSWASGTSPFADGNNQESSSEGVNAWTGVAAWAALRGDAAAAQRAQWMLAAEAHSAVALYVRPDTSFATGYQHSVVGIQWGAKRDWATWFSADPAAILGIQLIPLAPSQAAVLAPKNGADSARIVAAAKEAMPSGTAPQFTDLITMYSALAGKDAKAAAWSKAVALPDSAIDDGLSRAYMLAFIATAK